MDSISSPSALLGDNERETPKGFPATSQWNMIETLSEPINLPASPFRNPTQMDVITNNDSYDYDVQLPQKVFCREE